MRLLCMNDDYEKMASSYDYLTYKGVEVVHAKSGRFGMERLGFQSVDGILVAEKLTDMSGLEFMEDFVRKYPLVNSVLMSSLSSDDFHEQTEGMGILMQLSVSPTKVELDEMLKKFQQVSQMLGGLQGAA